jgi:energy-coupling factor transporter ATP-binding protein EcfA2
MDMPKIRLKSLMFEQPPFRKLGSMRIDFSERVTLIAGHNGIGKSTILGLVANGSGIRDAKLQSYLNRAYQAFLNDIVHLDFEREFNAFKSSGAALPTPYLEYDVDGDELIKKCSTTIREGESLRVVPRTDPHKPFISTSGTVKVGRDAKVPLPTLYLGMTRMLPVGESNPDWVVNDPDSQMHADDITFIESFVNQVIGGATSATGTHTITTQTIKGTGKTAKHPEYGHSPKCISLGQDSLSAIATAVASFQKLKREMPNYPGGLLVIDELDAGFHPHAQAKLASQLKKAARRLDLQIIATTHSMSLIEAVHGEEDGEGREKSPDSIVYLVDTTIPRVAKGYGIEDIRRDMQLTPPAIEQPPKSRSLKLYVEDPEAHFLLGKILTPKLKRRIKYEAGVNVTPISLSLGCDNLMGLHKYDPHFKTVLIAVDADASLKGQGKVDLALELRIP